jgi:intracellular septation protein A
MRLGSDIIDGISNNVLPYPLSYGIFATIIGLIALQVARENLEKQQYAKHVMVMICGGLCGWLFAISMKSYFYRPQEPFVFGLGVFFLIGTILLYKHFFMK